PDLAEAFMNKDKEVKIGDRVVHSKGAILSLNAQEATERINGKPLLAEGVVDSTADLTKKAGLKGSIVAIEPTGFEQIAFWITALAPLLLLGGILGAYLEFKIPGATWPGVISAICFALFFLGHYLALLARYLPRTSIYRRFALMDSNPPGPSLAGVPRQFATALALTPGTQGTAVTVLRPSGKARFADRVVDVVTEGEFIASQTPVTVIQTDGMRVVVKSAAQV